MNVERKVGLGLLGPAVNGAAGLPKVGVVGGLLVAMLAAGAPDVAAQAGVPGGDPTAGDRMRAEFYAHVLAGTDTALSRWSAAWREDRAAGAASLYAENAVLVLPDGSPVVGRDMIRELLEEGLPRLGEIQAGRRDFDASERMGYLSGTAHFEVGATAVVRGTSRTSHATVVLRDNEERWRIRFQLFAPEPGQESVPLRAPGGALMTPYRPDAVTTERKGPARGYYQRTYSAVSRAVGDLAVALQEGNLPRAVELYGSEARLRTPLSGGVLSGRSSLADHIPELASSGGQVHMAVLDFDASGRMAAVYGRYLIQAARGSGGEDLLGPYLLVFTLGGDEPRIRAHWMARDRR